MAVRSERSSLFVRARTAYAYHAERSVYQEESSARKTMGDLAMRCHVCNCRCREDEEMFSCPLCGRYTLKPRVIEKEVPKKDFHKRANYGTSFPEKLAKAEEILEPHYDGIMKLRGEGYDWKKISNVIRKATGSTFRETTLLTCIDKIQAKLKKKEKL